MCLRQLLLYYYIPIYIIKLSLLNYYDYGCIVYTLLYGHMVNNAEPASSTILAVFG